MGLLLKLLLEGVFHHFSLLFLLVLFFLLLLLEQCIVIIINFSPLVIANLARDAFNILSVRLLINYFLDILVGNALLLTCLQSEIGEPFVVHEFSFSSAHSVAFLVINSVEFHQVSILRHIIRLVFLVVHQVVSHFCPSFVTVRRSLNLEWLVATLEVSVLWGCNTDCWETIIQILISSCLSSFSSRESWSEVSWCGDVDSTQRGGSFSNSFNFLIVWETYSVDTMLLKDFLKFVEKLLLELF